MELTNFTLCNNINYENNSIESPFTVMNVGNFPFTATFYIMMGLYDDEKYDEYNLNVSIKISGGAVLHSSTYLLEPQETDYSAYLISLKINNMIFSNEGKYFVIVKFNNKEIGKIPFYLKKTSSR